MEPMFDTLQELANWLQHWRKEISIALVEEPNLNPRRSHTGIALKQGRGVGQIEGVLAGLDIPFKNIPARTWSASFPHGVTEKENKDKRAKLIKQARAKIVLSRFPGLDLRASDRCKTAHDGIVDAFLIALYGQLERVKDDEQERAHQGR